MLISQGGTGGGAAAPVVREIYDGIYGFSPSEDEEDEEGDDGEDGDGDQDERDPAIPGGKPPEELPTVRPDGSIVAPGESD